MVSPWPDRKPYLWLHSDSYIPDCDCGEREWQVDLPTGFVWRSNRNPYGDADSEDWDDMVNYANSLHPDHPDIVRVERRGNRIGTHKSEYALAA